MLVIFCPLFIEAEPLIHLLKLKKSSLSRKYSCYIDDERKIMLVISGAGRLNAACAAAAVLDGKECSHFFVFGGCAGLRKQKTGSVYLIHKAADINTGFSYYPDILGSVPFMEESVLTGDQLYGRFAERRDFPLPYDLNDVVHRTDFEEYGLYDMETAGFCYAASKYLGPHQVHLIRVVTDAGSAVKKEDYQKAVRNVSKDVCQYILSFKEQVDLKKTDAADDHLADLFCCSETMRHQLNQLIVYAENAGIEWVNTIRQFQQERKLPCQDREAGKRVLYEFGKAVAG